MKGYGQFCPIAKASEIVGERWTNLVIRELGAGSETFSDLRKGLPLMSPSLLSKRLKELERAGIVDRYSEGSGVRYRLTRAGDELTTIIWQLGSWGQRWVRSDLTQDDLDPSVLVWDIHRTLNSSYFKAERTVIEFEFIDYPPKLRFWWLVIRKGNVDVCLKNLGYTVDLKIRSDLKSMTEVWMGESTIMKAMREKNIQVLGDAHLKKNIAVWLGSNYYADIKPGTRK